MKTRYDLVMEHAITFVRVSGTLDMVWNVYPVTGSSHVVLFQHSLRHLGSVARRVSSGHPKTNKYKISSVPAL